MYKSSRYMRLFEICTKVRYFFVFFDVNIYFFSSAKWKFMFLGQFFSLLGFIPRIYIFAANIFQVSSQLVFVIYLNYIISLWMDIIMMHSRREVVNSASTLGIRWIHGRHIFNGLFSINLVNKQNKILNVNIKEKVSVKHHHLWIQIHMNFTHFVIFAFRYS